MLTNEQKLARKIGGSDTGVILGLSKKTPLQLYLEKTGQRESDIPEDEASQPDYIRFGNIMEAVIAGEYARRNGVKLRKVNQTMTSEEYPWMTAHPDRLIVGQQKGLEIKNTWAYNPDFGSDFADDIPDTHIAQVQHYMIVTGYRAWDLAVCLGGNRYKQYTINYNEKMARIIIEATREFWDRIHDGRPPEIVTPEDARLLYPDAASGKGVELADNYAHRIEDLKTLAEQMKLLEREQDEIKAELMAVMGDAEVGTFGGTPVCTWKNQTETRLDTKKLKELSPEIYTQFSKESTTRVFRLSAGGAK